MIKKSHLVHESKERRLVEALERKNIQTRVCKRYEYTDTNVKWADIVFTAGKDNDLSVSFITLLTFCS